MGIKENFIGNLRSRRAERGLSQMKLAELCDTATSYIGEIEIGRRFPSLKLIEKIAAALRVEPYEFFIPAPPAPLADTPAGEPAAAEAPAAEIEAAIRLLCRLPADGRLRAIHTLSGERQH
jgi:transcriptional regulator with XRE-family HTH domain